LAAIERDDGRVVAVEVNLAPTRERRLDITVVLLLSSLEGPAALPELPLVSAVTLAEISVCPLVARTDAERAARQAVLQQP